MNKVKLFYLELTALENFNDSMAATMSLEIHFQRRETGLFCPNHHVGRFHVEKNPQIADYMFLVNISKRE